MNHSTADAPLKGVPSTSDWMKVNRRQRMPGEATMAQGRPGLFARIFKGSRA